MRGLIKGTIIFALGAGLGVLGSAGYFYRHAQKACNDYEEKHNKELDEILAMYESSNAAVRDKEARKDDPAPKKPNSQSVSAERVDYTKFSKEPEDIKDVVKRAEEKLASEEGPMEEDTRSPKLKGPRQIKNEDYGTDRTLDCIELTYYAGNDILANEDDEVIDEDVEYALLGDVLDRFGFRNSDQPKICVRNEKRGADYMISKVHTKYIG